MKKIESVANPNIKNVVKLHDAKNRKEKKLFIAEGLRVCQTLIESSLKIEQLYCTEKMIKEAKKLTHEYHIILVSEAIMKKIAATTTPSGILGVFHIPSVVVPSKLQSGAVLANITDPGNMGTLIRSSVAFGFTQIVIVEGCDPWNQKVVQASAGTIGFAQIILMSWHNLKNIKTRPSLAALVPSDGIAINSKSKHLLIIGNEAHGIPTPWLAECDKQITLSMKGPAESLNAAIAGSIALYEMSKNF